MKIHVLGSVLCRRHEEGVRSEDHDKEEKEEKARKIRRPKSKKIKKKVASILGDKENRCACCLKPLVPSRAVNCCNCGARACQKKCSRSDQPLDWYCLFCYQQRAWLQNKRRCMEVFDRLKTQPGIARSFATSSSETQLIPRGDNVVPDTKSAVYTAIRKLVDHAVDEVNKLPSLEDRNSSNGCTNANQEFSSSRQNQENLLATVVFNKVIAKCQSEETSNGNVLNINQNDNHLFETSSSIDGDSQSCNRSLEFIPKSRQTISVASKFTQTRPFEFSSLMYEERIEEVAAYISEKFISTDSYDGLEFCNYHPVPFPESGIDIASHSSGLAEDEERNNGKNRSLPHSWKENWYFRKKKSSPTTPAVSMFVPNSNADYRALIGDKDIDETSDLSEYSTYSDDDIETTHLVVLGVKNSHVDVNDEGAAAQSTKVVSVTEEESIANKPDTLFSFEDNTTDKDLNLNSSQPGHSSYCQHLSPTSAIGGWPEEESLELKEKKEENSERDELFRENLHQRDRECNEHNTLVPRRRCTGRHHHSDSISFEKQKGTHGKMANDVELVDNFHLFAPPARGSIAEREHKKWLNAVHIENNPYSPENIKKRLIQRQYSPKPTVLPSYSDRAIGVKQGFQALADDNETSVGQLADKGEIWKNKENPKRLNSHNEESQIITNSAYKDDSDKPTESSEKCDEIFMNGHQGKNGSLSKTRLIKSYFENGERRENTRDANGLTRKAKNIDGQVLMKKTFRRQDSTEAKIKNNSCKSFGTSLDDEMIDQAANGNIDDKITLPSVKKIVQAFNEKIQSEKMLSSETSQRVANKSDNGEEEEEEDVEEDEEEDEEQTTQVIRRTAKQSHLHSLTARSLSREFREGLRQVPKKT